MGNMNEEVFVFRHADEGSPKHEIAGQVKGTRRLLPDQPVGLRLLFGSLEMFEVVLPEVDIPLPQQDRNGVSPGSEKHGAKDFMAADESISAWGKGSTFKVPLIPTR